MEFKLGNWVLNKNAYAPFCAVSPDNALEHVNRSLKVSGGLVGIMLNPTHTKNTFCTRASKASIASQADGQQCHP